MLITFHLTVAGFFGVFFRFLLKRASSVLLSYEVTPPPPPRKSTLEPFVTLGEFEPGLSGREAERCKRALSQCQTAYAPYWLNENENHLWWSLCAFTRTLEQRLRPCPIS